LMVGGGGHQVAVVICEGYAKTLSLWGKTSKNRAQKKTSRLQKAGQHHLKEGGNLGHRPGPATKSPRFDGGGGSGSVL